MTTTTNNVQGQSQGLPQEPLSGAAEEGADKKNGFQRASTNAQQKLGKFTAGLKEVSGWDIDTPAESVEDEDDINFMRDTSAAFLQQTPTGARLVIWASVLLVFILVAWSMLAEIDEITRGEGKVIPSQKLKVVQNLEGGILSELLIKEGDKVKINQILLRIDDTRFSSSFEENQLRYFELSAKAARLSAEADNKPFVIPEKIKKEAPDLVQQELNLYESRKRELSKNLQILEQQRQQRYQELREAKARSEQVKRSYDIVHKEWKLTKPLVAEGAASEVEVLRLERQVNELRGELENSRLAIPRVESMYREAKQKTEEAELRFSSQARQELNETLAEIPRLKESSSALEDRVERTVVRSPVTGTVQQILVNTVGGVIQPGMDLVEIVPTEDKLVIEAKVKPADIAQLHPSQRAVVKFTAYDFAIYGSLEAEVVHISADTITDERDETFYLVRVETDENHLSRGGEEYPIIPGMVTNVDVLTGKKSIWDYLMKPVRRGIDRAMTER